MKLFTIIIVSLNAGEELKKTVDSVLSQNYGNYEILIKDGYSTDGSLKSLPEDERIRTIVKKDRSIYDAMNQAVREAKGKYYLFLNCGDYLYDEHVLGRIAKAIAVNEADIFYGDLYRRKQESVDVSPERISSFTAYRNIPCHQVCFYNRRLFLERGYDLKIKIRADYEHFLWCLYKKSAKCTHVAVTVASYEGGGFSETEENREISKKEHAEITKNYLGAKVYLYKFIMFVTLQPLREKLANDKRFSSVYFGLKKLLSGHKR